MRTLILLMAFLSIACNRPTSSTSRDSKSAMTKKEAIQAIFPGSKIIAVTNIRANKKVLSNFSAKVKRLSSGNHFQLVSKKGNKFEVVFSSRVTYITDNFDYDSYGYLFPDSVHSDPKDDDDDGDDDGDDSDDGDDDKEEEEYGEACNGEFCVCVDKSDDTGCSDCSGGGGNSFIGDVLQTLSF